ncbi:MAG: ABC transporter substrate-binding protein [Eggerthellaceae bacterium]|nr:ABC transporter substrate-binding protein [Eggerthellaceae bacterium]
MTGRVVSCAWLRPRTVLLALCAFFAVVLAACSPASIGSTAASSSASAASASGASSTTTVVDNFHNADLGNGMKPVDSLKLDYAKCFTVDYYDGGYKLFCLSDGSRYLAVPEGKSAPEGMSSDITVIQQPVGDVYLVASDTMCLFDALNALDRITVSGISRDNWYLPAAQKAMDEGTMVYGGKYNAPDYELLLGKGVRLAVESTMINHTPSVREKLIELGIPVFTEMSSYESEPLGRTEWVKCYGAMLDKEGEAKALFDEQVAQVKGIDSTATGKTVAFFYINSNGSAIVRKPGDYVTKMIDQAGGSYIFDSLEEGEGNTSSVTLEMEQFYSIAKDADIIIYNTSIDGSVESVDDLVKKNALLADFAAVKNGNVWATDQNMYQQMMQTGRIIADFNAAITGSGADTTYVHKLG